MALFLRPLYRKLFVENFRETQNIDPRSVRCATFVVIIMLQAHASISYVISLLS